ncbi:MAG: DUF305 domain-containing protein [Gemmatimonadaceae bacterium]
MLGKGHGHRVRSALGIRQECTFQPGGDTPSRVIAESRGTNHFSAASLRVSLYMTWKVGLILVVVASGCSSARHAPVAQGPAPITVDPNRVSPAELARADGGRPRYTAADVQFMSAMIPHHAQAVLIAGWAATHGARADLSILCERIVVAQADEIATMQRWLRERGESVPDGSPTHMPGMQHGALMPGMLTADELLQRDRARGAEFDRLFLIFMIRHHEGALSMVDRLFGSAGAAQDDVVFKFASDVYADQSTEIDRMQRMPA